MSTEPITKLDAARRQLRTAVKLFFEYGDDVAIHTLVGAARGVLIDLLKRQGKEKQTPLAKLIDDQTHPDSRGNVHKAFEGAQDFFKHGQRGESMDFDPRQTHFLLVDCGHAYHALTGGYLRELLCFGLWFDLEYPEVVKGEPSEAVAKEGAPHHDRTAFVAEFNRRAWPNVD